MFEPVSLPFLKLSSSLIDFLRSPSFSQFSVSAEWPLLCSLFEVGSIFSCPQVPSAFVISSSSSSVSAFGPIIARRSKSLNPLTMDSLSLLMFDLNILQKSQTRASVTAHSFTDPSVCEITGEIQDGAKHVHLFMSVR